MQPRDNQKGTMIAENRSRLSVKQKISERTSAADFPS